VKKGYKRKGQRRGRAKVEKDTKEERRGVEN